MIVDLQSRLFEAEMAMRQRGELDSHSLVSEILKQADENQALRGMSHMKQHNGSGDDIPNPNPNPDPNPGPNPGHNWRHD